MTASQILLLYLVLFAIEYSWEMVLEILNIKHVKKNKSEIPAAFQATTDKETYEKSINYTLTNTNFGLVSSAFSSVLLLVIVLSGALGIVDDYLGTLGLGTYSHGVLFIYTLALFFSLSTLPFSIYSTFVIEEKFGFNKMTWKLFIIDAVKGMVLSALFLTPLLYALFWFMDTAGPNWWIYAFSLFAAFQLLMVLIYPTLIAPLFNKFSPLGDGELKDKILALAEKVGFKTNGIFVMDGSKRSRHSNAYFTGLGKLKRIVLFDTLVESSEPEELLAVLAHEIGHEKKNHIKKGMALSLLSMGIGFWILSLLLPYAPFYQAFGFSENSYHAAIILFSFCSGPFTFYLAPLRSKLSRKHEYEADRFAVEATGGANGLKNALLRLSKDNLSNLTPHPLYSGYHYSHPTLSERIAAMEKHATILKKA
ncbi:MAG: M48 family peptidase [Calditrichaeota bacterium]|nr:MAG: M48 family peptidase [Calditrichota bacterium]